MCTKAQQQFPGMRAACGSDVFLDDALLLTVSRIWDRIGFVEFPVGCISLLTGDAGH